MARGPKKHLKRINAPRSWMLDKIGGVFAPRPSCGPHKLRNSLPLIVILRNRLKYALNYHEVVKIVIQRTIKIDGKIRTDKKYPTGLMDVLSIERTGENFRILYDVKGRFILHKISAEEASYKLCRVKKAAVGANKIPYVVTHDGRTIRYPDPMIKANDTIKFDINTGKIIDFVKFEVGQLCLVTGGHSMGRIGTIISRERHPGSFDIIHVKDAVGNTFATRLNNIFVIGSQKTPFISLPKGKGIRLSIMEERTRRLAKRK
ncbi:hypothetical protein RND71_043888 [Anisodus tanguticus]|uniref:40S ribosomal protein S4 n=1 Tax=Anisodus tanguticus TaxID=243964 RepID=A0AAE1QPZ6_9SOLA|nr:hypothetical protein RND71_043888 [Anisodus tanguticus]